MPINPANIKWDTPTIDASTIKWDTPESTMDKVKGVGEAARAVLGGAVSWIPQGIINAAGAVSGQLPEAMEMGNAVSTAITGEPQTETGKKLTGYALYPFEKLGEFQKWAGEKTYGATDSPAWAAAAETAVGAIPFVALPGIKAGRKTLKDIKSLDQLRDILVEAKQPTVPVTRQPMGPDAAKSPWNPQMADQLRAIREVPLALPEGQGFELSNPMVAEGKLMRPGLPPGVEQRPFALPEGQGFIMPDGTPYLPEASKAIPMGYEPVKGAPVPENVPIQPTVTGVEMSPAWKKVSDRIQGEIDAFNAKKKLESPEVGTMDNLVTEKPPVDTRKVFKYEDIDRAIQEAPDTQSRVQVKKVGSQWEVSYPEMARAATQNGVKGFEYETTYRKKYPTKTEAVNAAGKEMDVSGKYGPEVGQVVIQSPGGAVYKVWNTKETLEDFKKRVTKEFPGKQSTTLFSNPFGAAAKWAGEKLYEPAIRIGDMLFNPNRVLEKVDTPETRGHEFQRKAIDRSISIKDFEQGKDVSPQESPYLLNERTRSMVGSALEEVDKMQRAWTGEAVKATKPFGESLNNVSDYLYAKFALQRNKTVEARRAELIAKGENPGDFGSGMSDADAHAIIQNVASSGKTAIYDKIAAPIWDMGRNMRDLLQKEGMIDAETAAAWEADGGPFYVTLQGGVDKASPMYSQGTAARSGTGIKSYVGRMSKADDPITNMFRQYKNVIQRVHENRVRQSVLDLVTKDPDPSITVNEWQSKMKYDRETGQVTPVTEPPWMSSDPAIRENTVPVMKDGKNYYMTFHDNPLLARALKGTPDQMGKTMQYLAGGVRVLSALKTKYAPDFLVTNPIRDYLDSLHAITVEDSMSLAKDTGRDVFKGMAATWRQARGKFDPSNQWDMYANEFKRNGGRTGYYALRDFEAEAAHINNLAARFQGDAKGNMLQTWDKTMRFVEDFGSMTENGIRQSLYTNMRKRGHSVEEAIHAAKNVTINFDKQGEWGPRMKALYMFINPSIQGSKRFVELMTHPSKKGAAIAASAFSAALALSEMNRWIAGEDENGISKWDRVSSTDKTRNLIIMRPDSDQPLLKVPLGFYQRLFFGAAASIDEAVRNPMKSPGGAAADLVNATIDAFNPMGGGNIKTAAIPSAIRPIAEAAINETWAGTPMHPELMPNEYKAKSEKYFESATELGKGTASYLNRMTGGDEVESGKISVSPNTIDYLANFYIGDPAVSLGRLVDTAAKYYQGKEMSSQKIPIARRFTGANTEYAYTKWKQEAAKEAGTQYARDKLSVEKQGEDPSEYEMSPMGELGRETPSFNKDYAELKSLMKDLYSDKTKDWTREEKLTVQKQLKEEMETMLKSYVGAYLRQRQIKTPQQQVY